MTKSDASVGTSGTDGHTRCAQWSTGGSAKRDEDAAQDQRTDDAVEQPPLLEHLRDGERREQQHEHEQGCPTLSVFSTR